MSKKLMYLISFVLLVSFVSFGFNGFKVSAATNNEDTMSEIEDIIENNNLELVDPNFIPENQRLNFDTIEEFEKFIQEDPSTFEDENVMIEDETNKISLFATTETLTNSYVEKSGFGKITSYVRFTKNKSTKKVSGVKIWSEQTGVLMGITYIPNDNASYYEMNSTKTGGKAYAKGSKLYGVNVVGQPVGYQKSVTYTIKY
ncbi:hypothetical protein ACIQXR_10365 [Peribacillus sp. NPDC097224]|uniref:hypothetical protein n=1 Tax=Peribacillus sp. NPDC097224 TaxID=3364399 RepID=UPI0038304604